MYHINKESIGNGENIALQNTAKHYFKKFDILGNSKQDTREGYNLLQITREDVTAYGVTVTVNKDKSITFNGTATSYATFILSNIGFTMEAGDYVLSNRATGTVNGISFIRFDDANGNTIGNNTSHNSQVTKFTLTENKEVAKCRADFSEGSVLTNYTIYPMLIKGTEEKPYEQYGASPSIEYEAPIESVGDNINEFDGKIELGGYSGSTGGAYNATDRVRSINKTSLSAGTYTVSSNGASAIAVECWNSDDTYNKEYNTNHGSKLTFTLESDSKIHITAVNTELLNSKIKLEKGTKTTPYSPYGQGSIEVVNCNGNFLKNEATSQTINGIKFTVNENGTVIANGTATANAVLVLNSSIKINQEDMRLRGCPANGSTSTFALGLRGNNNSQLIYDTGNGNNINATDTEYTARIVIFSGITVNNLLFAPMITKGLTDYVEHQSQTKALYTQQPFRAIGDVKDRFVKQNGVWYEEHKIRRYYVTGVEENWSTPNTNYYNLDNAIKDYLKLDLQKTTHLSNNYLNVAQRSSNVGFQESASLSKYDYVFDLNSSLDYYTLRFKDVRGLSLEDFKSWIAEQYENGTPVYVDYVLATPTLIECTAEQVEVLEYLDKEIKSYDEQTNISSTDAISPIFDVTAYQRISEEFKTRLKEGKITRGYLKVLATDTLPELIIDENNYLKDLKIEELRYVPEEGFIGGAVAKRVTGNFNNVDNSFDIQDREVEVYLGVELEDETTEYIKYGTYIVQRPEDDQVNDNTSFEALDYMVKFNQEYKDRITYPCTLKQLLDDIVEQAGVSSKVATFANSDFIVENNQFEQGTTLRDVLKAITQVAFNWSRIDADDNLVMDFDIKEDIDEELGTDDYFGFKKTDDYGPVNVIVLRNSQVEGENVTIKDEALINSPKGYNRLKVTATSKTENGITFTVNKDGTVFGDGTATADTTLLIQPITKYDKGDYILSDEANGSGTTYFTRLYRGSSGYDTIAQTTAGTTKFSLNEDTEFRTYILIKSGATLNNVIFKPMIVRGKEEKPYQPYIPNGEVELVIADNPFAYTELKRKQLIEAGRRLFGLRYTPMTVDMLGLMYLNAKDRITVENLNGEKFNTYLLDHTIDYTGILLDSMQSQAKTKTETKYQYLSPLAQGLSHVEIKVDKANKRIESIVQTQEDVSEKVAKTVARIEVVYALSDSPTTAPTEGWSTTAPKWTAGKYMWQKTITTYANGTTAETAATNISGAKGEAGQNGIGITQTNITYQKSTSGTTVPTGTWQTTIPEVNEDGYLWTRTEFIYSDGSKKYAYNVGKKGATGIGVKSLVDQYYLSTSNTEQTGGKWTETQPEWQDKTYIWTRTKINWTDNSITYTDPVLANTLNDINSNIVVLRELSSSQIVENGKIITRIEETTKRLNNDYSTTEQVDSKINGLEDKYKTLEKRFVDIEASNKEYAIKINAIDNNGVDKVKTLMGYTFNDKGLNINRDNADTGTIVDEAGIQVVDKTGAGDPTDILYAGYVKKDNTKYADYAGQTIVATSNLIVKNFLVIGSNSRFQDYTNPILGGQGTGVYDI